MHFDVSTFPTQGRHLIEASAGTGKTHNLMALAIKQLQSGNIQPDELVMMTFTRASTRELRARLREHLSLASRDASEPATQSRLEHAIRRLDRVTILTIHGFAIQVLNTLGPSVGIHSKPMNEDTDPLFLDAALDVYRALKQTTPWEAFQATLGSADEFSKRAVIAQQRASLWLPDGQTAPDLEAVPEEYHRRAAALLETIDVLKHTKGAHAKTIDKHCQNALGARLPSAIPGDAIRYFKGKVSDEPLFQAWVDLAEPTPSQIAFRAFALQQVLKRFESLLLQQDAMHPDQIIADAAAVAARINPNDRPSHRMILVDEFQDTDQDQWTLLDQLYPDQTDRLMVLVGDPKQAIYRFRGADTRLYHQVRNSLPPAHLWTLQTNYRSADTLVQGLNRLYDRAHPIGTALGCVEMQTGRTDLPPMTLDQHPLAGFQWCAALDPKGVAALAAHLIGLGATGRLTLGEDPVKAGDIGVLVDSWEVASSIQQAGRPLGVSFHYADHRSVFAEPLSREMVHVLDAIANPDDLGAISAAAATDLIGLRLTGSGTLPEHPEFSAFQADLLKTRDTWYREGPAAALAGIFNRYHSQARIRHDASGLTGWMALAQCLEVFGETAKGLNPLEAARWWAHRATDGSKAVENQKPRAPNRNSVVTITTIHGAKGLQYPIVIIAGRLKIKSIKGNQYAQTYCTDQGLVLDFRPEGQGLAAQDLVQDAHRLTYVALTRAQHGVFLAEPTEGSALGMVVDGRGLDTLGAHHQTFDVPDAPQPVPPWDIPIAQPLTLNRSHTPTWFVRSYSSLTRNQHDSEQPTRADDEHEPHLMFTPEPTAAAWHHIEGGADTGNFIHAVLEHAARRPDPAAIAASVEQFWPSHLERQEQAEVLRWIDAIRSVPLPGGQSLHQMPVQSLRPEPQFQLPFRAGLTLETLFDSFRALSWWDDAVPDSKLPLRGQLTGFIDLVYESGGRYYVLDYKTNRLGERGAQYTATAIAQTMRASHYQSQAAIYALALHRWLEQRLPEYDPHRHLGEVVYVFARGIDGPVQGIWSRSIEPDSLLTIASRCLHASRN